AGRGPGHARAHVALVVGGHALEAADRDRLGLRAVVLLDPPAPAGRLAGAVAGAAEDPREDVAVPVDHVGVGVAAGGDQADVLGDRRVRRAGPLAIDDPVEGVRIADIGWLQSAPRLGWKIALANRSRRPRDPESSAESRPRRNAGVRAARSRTPGNGRAGNPRIQNRVV